MKKFILLLIILIGTTNAITAQLNNYTNGDTVTDFTVTDVYGNEHNLYSYTAAGKYVYIDFFYSICGGCQDFIPIFNGFYDKYGCNEGELVCISINSGYDKDIDVINFENTYGGSTHHAPAISLDGGCEIVVADFDPMYYPAKCLIGPDNIMLNSNINPFLSIIDLEKSFPSDFNPTPANCTIGLKELDTSVNFSISPNPIVNNVFTINLKGADSAQLSIYTLLGKKVFSKTISSSSQKITSTIDTGIYFIFIQTRSGTYSEKIMIK